MPVSSKVTTSPDAAEPLADRERQARLVERHPQPLRLGRVAREREREGQARHGLAGGAQQAAPEGEGRRLDLSRGAPPGRRRGGGGSSASRRPSFQSTSARGQCRSIAARACCRKRRTRRGSVMTRPSVCGSCSLPMQRDGAAREVGAEVAGAAHQRLAADHLAGHQLLDQVAAQARLGLGAHLLARPLQGAGLGQLGQRGLPGPATSGGGTHATSTPIAPVASATSARLTSGISSSMNGPDHRRRPVAARALDRRLEEGLLVLAETGASRAGRGTRRGSRPARRAARGPPRRGP